MIIRVHGCKDLELEKTLIDATEFFARELLSRQMLPHIMVDIRLVTKMKDLGCCSILFFNDNYKPREFEIDLRRHRSVKNTLITLAHEMVHLKQFAKCELKDDHTRWRGFVVDSEAIDYHDLPWEIEANTLEYILYTLYIEEKQKGHHNEPLALLQHIPQI